MMSAHTKACTYSSNTGARRVAGNNKIPKNLHKLMDQLTLVKFMR